MSGRIDCTRLGETGTIETTLLELVQAVSEVTSDEREVVATILEMLNTGRARLRGSFRGSRLDAA